jgi:hypothetical protein
MLTVNIPDSLAADTLSRHATAISQFLSSDSGLFFRALLRSLSASDANPRLLDLDAPDPLYTRTIVRYNAIRDVVDYLELQVMYDIQEAVDARK